MKIEVCDDVCLTEIKSSDKQSFMEYLNDKGIYQNTLSIPSPYKESDAEQWISVNEKIFAKHGQHFNLAIRKGEELVGVIGLLDVGEPHPHRAEVGYWLARMLWNRGIMTFVLRQFMHHAFSEFDLEKMTAHVFAGNAASNKVLTKCGFKLEGSFEKHYKKNERFIDAIAFGLMRRDFEKNFRAN